MQLARFEADTPIAPSRASEEWCATRLLTKRRLRSSKPLDRTEMHVTLPSVGR